MSIYIAHYRRVPLMQELSLMVKVEVIPRRWSSQQTGKAKFGKIRGGGLPLFPFKLHRSCRGGG